jgi:hypothetical protein
VISLHHVEYTRNPISSGVLLFYWLFVIVADGIRLRTRWMKNDGTDVTQIGLFTFGYILSATMFVLENLEKPKSQYIMLEDEVKRKKERKL